MDRSNEYLIPGSKEKGLNRQYISTYGYLGTNPRSSIVHRWEQEPAVSSLVLLAAEGVTWNPWVSAGGDQ